MKNYLLYMLLLGFNLSQAQKSYSEMTREALETMWKASDSNGYKKALDLYEEAFRKFPDSIDRLGLYKASVIASELNEYDKAFKYLIPLSEIAEDEYGNPGWVYIVGPSEAEYKNLANDKRWSALKQTAVARKEKFYQVLKENQDEFFDAENRQPEKRSGVKKIYSKLKKFSPYKSKKQQDYSILFAINDTVNTSYFIHLPEKYDASKKYPMLVFLHGAVRNNALVDYQTAKANLFDWNRFYTKYAAKGEVILVFPKGDRQYNWMKPDDGFFMVPEMIAQIKASINVDDDRIFISGHSNGATGSFSYLVKQPTKFAGFYGFNTYPKVFTGGTFVENTCNRSFINFSTDKDYYYPAAANDDLSKLMNEIKADYKDYRYNGFPHWFPEFDSSEPAYGVLFGDIAARKRNPFPKKISWEFDDVKYGNIDWLSQIELDTLKSRSNWHKDLNFKISRWLEYDKNDSLVTKEVAKNAFDFPRKSGKIRAEYDNNVFRIETSCIASFTINIAPEMVDIRKKVKVFVNGKLCFDQKAGYNKEFMLQNFSKNKDRTQIWINHIDIKIE